MTNTEPLIDLRAIFFYIASILSPVGVALNIFLLYLILCKTSSKMADYKIVLLHNWFADLLFNFSELVECHTESKTGTFYVVGSSWLKPLTYFANICLIHFWIFALFFCCTTIPPQFVYRYLIIVHNRKLTNFEYLKMLIITVIGSFLVVGLWIFAELSDTQSYEYEVLLLKSDPYYFRETPYFISAQIQQLPLRFCCGVALSLAVISYGITIYTAFKVWKKLKSVYHIMSPATRQMHNQMTKTMILQAIVPLIFILFPISVVITFLFLLLDIPGFGILCNLFCCFIPVVNPLVTIFSIKSYRSTVFNCFQRSIVFVPK